MGSTTAQASAPAKRGSFFSDKQIFQSVRDERAVIVTLPSGEQVTGWVYGADDFHWGIASAGRTVLVHKSTPMIEFDPDGSEPSDWVRETVSPFRRYVMKNHFSQDQPTA